jgi:hypothetical protein
VTRPPTFFKGPAYLRAVPRAALRPRHPGLTRLIAAGPQDPPRGAKKNNEGESYRPDCTRYEVEELVRQADEEARILRQAEALAAGLDAGPAGDGPPF